jgi:protein SCO1
MSDTSAQGKLSAFAPAGPRLWLGPLFLFACCLLTPSAYGQAAPSAAAAPETSAHKEGHDHSSHAAPAHPLHRHELLEKREVTTVEIPDLALTDQDGRRVRLYDDVMKDRLVVLNFFYTTCEGVCATAGFWLSNLQAKLGGRLGREVVLVSISIDPAVDTPDRINRWAAQWKRRPGWTLLTSEGAEARALVRRFLPEELKSMHSPVVFVGDGARRRIGWIGVDIVDESRALLDYFDKMKAR